MTRWIRANRRGAAPVLWAAVVSALTLHSFHLIRVNFGGGWEVALQLANHNHVPLGSRPVFTYGPYGFLDIRSPFFTRQWLEAVGFSMLIHVASVGAIAILLWRLRIGLLAWSVVTAALLFTLSGLYFLELEGSILAVVLVYLSIDVSNPRGRGAAVASTGFVLALLLLIKSSALVIVGGAVVVLVPTMAVSRRWRSLATLMIVFVITGAALWVPAGLGSGDVVQFLRSYFEFGVGYGPALYLGQPDIETALGAALVVASGLLGIRFLVSRQISLAGWFFSLFAFSFAVFKDTFVRAGPFDRAGRYSTFFAIVALMFTLSLILTTFDGRHGEQPTRQRFAVGLVLAVAISSAVVLPRYDANYSVASITSRWASYRVVISAITSPAFQTDLEQRYLALARQHYARWIRELTLPGGATLDVVPEDVDYFYADSRYTWDPRPVLQSQNAYTEWLDNTDASFMTANDAPRYLVYSWEIGDNRYQLFDEPSMFRALLQHYRVARVLDKKTVLLERDSAITSGVTQLGQTCAAFGKPIPIPQVRGAYVFGSLDVEPSLLGRLLNVAYRPPSVSIALGSGASIHTFRLVTGVSLDGLFVSSFVQMPNPADGLTRVFEGRASPDITSLSVSTSSALGWQSPDCITFSEMSDVRTHS